VSGVQTREVRREEEGWRLDRWVREHFPVVTHGALQKLLRTGQFRVDGKRVEAGTRLAPGQTVRVPPLPEGPAPHAAKPAAPAARRVLSPEDARLIRSLVVHEEPGFFALNKPAGLAVQGGTGTTRHVDGLLDALAERGGERPRLVHRLDRDTSGLLVVARSAQAAKELMHAFQQHRVRKLYWAVLLRGPERNEGVIDLPLGKRGPAGAERVAPVGDDDEEGAGGDARWARTAYRVLLRAGKVAAWTALQPLTGRTHQLRAHCAAIQAPILGDGKYGGRAAHPDGAPKGLMLHARELELPRPKGKPLRLKADPPRHFREALAWLGMGVEDLPGASLRDWPPPG
jgi:23S rRNA pseudouridine955/2504/2580 synthase